MRICHIDMVFLPAFIIMLVLAGCVTYLYSLMITFGVKHLESVSDPRVVEGLLLYWVCIAVCELCYVWLSCVFERHLLLCVLLCVELDVVCVELDVVCVRLDVVSCLAVPCVCVCVTV